MMSWKFVMLSFIITCLQDTPSDALKVLGVFPLTSRSHFLMYGTLMKELALRGHHVDVVSMFPHDEPILNYRDIPITTDKTHYFLNNLSYTSANELGSLSLNYIMEVCGTHPCDQLGHPNMEKILKTKKGTYDVIIMEIFLADCYVPLGRHLNAPIVGITALALSDWLVAPFGNSLNPSYIPSLYSRFGPTMTFWERLQNTIVTNLITYGVHYRKEAQLNYVEKYFGRKLGSIQELYQEISILLVNEHSSINNIRPLSPDVIGVGGMHTADDDQPLTPELEKWLDKSTDGCVYFSLGSKLKIETFPNDTIAIFYELFKRIAPMRVIMKLRDHADLPANLPNNVKTLPWLPQAAILKHKNMKLFITHGGLMGTQEAIVYRVPMVGLPVFIDQHSNMGASVYKKIAIALDPHHLTADALTDAVKTVLNDPTYRNNIEKISKLFLDRPMSAIDTAVYWIEYTARHGTVLKSPATELTWWQFHLLDVYGFILTCLLVALYILKNIAVWLRKQTIQFRMKYPNISLKHKKTK